MMADKYYEVFEPYYALIKAQDIEAFEELYIEYVYDDIDLDNVKEVEGSYASFKLGMYISSSLSDMGVSRHDILRNDKIEESYQLFKATNVLLIDGELF